MRALRILCTVGGLALCMPAMAGSIAYVDYSRLLQKAPQIAASGKLLKQEFAPRLQAINEQKGKLENLRRQLDELGPGANPLKRSSLIEKFRHTQAALKKAEQSYSSAFDLRREQLRDNFRQVVDSDVKTYAKAHGIEVVLKGGGIYAAPGIDLTAAILKQLRENYRQAQAQEKGKKTRKP